MTTCRLPLTRKEKRAATRGEESADRKSQGGIDTRRAEDLGKARSSQTKVGIISQRDGRPTRGEGAKGRVGGCTKKTISIRSVLRNRLSLPAQLFPQAQLLSCVRCGEIPARQIASYSNFGQKKREDFIGEIQNAAFQCILSIRLRGCS